MNKYNKSIAILSLFSLPINVMALNSNQPYKATEIKSSQMLKGIKTLTMAQTSSIPTIEVEMKNGSNKYNFVNQNQSFSVKTNVSINCRLTNGVKTIYAGITPVNKNYTPAQSQHAQYFEYFDHKPTSGYKKKRDVTLTLKGNIKKELSKIAINQCNKNLANRDLSKDTVFNWTQVSWPNMLATRITGWCSAMPGQIGQAVKINYKCKALPEELKIDNKLIIHSVDLKAPIKNYVGQCPKKISFLGTIKTNGANQNLRYRFKNHLNVSTPWKQFSTTKNTYNVSHSITLEDIKQINNLPKKLKQPNEQVKNTYVQSKKLKDVPFVTLEVENIKTRKIHKAKEQYNFKCIEKVKPQRQIKQQPDLVVLEKTVKLANKAVKNINGSLSLVIGTEQAISKSNGLCKFRMSYGIKNIGNVKAKPAFTNQVKNLTNSLLISPTTELMPNKTKLLNGMVTLKPGKHILSIKTDHADKVKESNENNNLVRLSIELKGDCGAKPTERLRH